MTTLNDLLDIPGVVGAGRWKAADSVNAKPPEILEVVGAIQGNDAVMAMHFLESDGIRAGLQANLLDAIGSGEIKMSPVQGVAVMGPTHTFCATINRVGVCIENDAKVELWNLGDKMMSI